MATRCSGAATGTQEKGDPISTCVSGKTNQKQEGECVCGGGRELACTHTFWPDARQLCFLGSMAHAGRQAGLLLPSGKGVELRQ